MPNCPNCGSADVRESEALAAAVLCTALYPITCCRCDRCRYVSIRPRRKGGDSVSPGYTEGKPSMIRG